TTLVHALKSALANIGAEALSQTAALLEKAGREADLPAIRGQLPPFRGELALLTGRIGEAATAEPAGDGETRTDPAIGEAGERLREALAARDIEAIDAALARLRALPPTEKTRETVSEIADHVLTADFRKAAEAVNVLLARDKAR
ncbi:MAG: Hpt domain-containing protein, partial [Planctomycetota bacterium]|nr:Hpt domain-containing protein [Planctomycetota bacterium]